MHNRTGVETENRHNRGHIYKNPPRLGGSEVSAEKIRHPTVRSKLCGRQGPHRQQDQKEHPVTETLCVNTRADRHNRSNNDRHDSLDREIRIEAGQNLGNS